MRIVINALSVKSGGGLTAMLNLLPALDRVDPQNDYCVIVSRVQERLIRAIPERFETYFVSIDSNSLVMRMTYEQVALPFVLWKLRADWLYSVGGQTTLVSAVKILLLVENANPFSKLDIDWIWKDRLRHSALRVLTRFSARRARWVRFVSENSRRIIVDALSIEERKTVVIPHGATLAPNRQNSHGRFPFVLPDRYVLFVSNIGPHKNVHTLVEAFKNLVEKDGYPGMLLLAGHVLSPTYEARLHRLIRGTTVENRVTFLGWVDPGDMAGLFERAELFVFPSVEETFGIPVLEAMAMKVPVVVPEAPDDRYFIPYRELCEEGAVYFRPDDSSDLCTAMSKVLRNPVLRERLIAAGLERIQHFRWETTASRMAELFHHSPKED